MCSMKCEMPSLSAGSSRAPLRTHTPAATERRCGSFSVTMVIPEGSTDLWNSNSVIDDPCPEVSAARRSNIEWQVALPLAPHVLHRCASAPPAPIAVALATSAATRAAGAGPRRHSALGLGEQRLAGQLDLPVPVHPDHLHHHHVPDVEDVLGARHPVVIELRDVEQPVPPRHDLDERPEGHHAPHLALVHAAGLGVLGDVADPLLRP